MQVGKDWIDFSWKSPYSTIQGKPLPEDFEVIVAYEYRHIIHYKVMKATKATSLYNSYPTRYLAWRAFESYDPLIKR